MCISLPGSPRAAPSEAGTATLGVPPQVETSAEARRWGRSETNAPGQHGPPMAPPGRQLTGWSANGLARPARRHRARARGSIARVRWSCWSTGRSTVRPASPGSFAGSTTSTPWSTTAAATTARGARSPSTPRSTGTSTTSWRSSTDGPAVVVGHSYGGDVALGAALRAGANGIHRRRRPPTSHRCPGWACGRQPDRHGRHQGRADPAGRATAAGPPSGSSGGWSATPPGSGSPRTAKAARRADGPALAAELAAIRLAEAPFDVDPLPSPRVFGRGENSAPRHRESVAWLVEHTPGAELVEIPGRRPRRPPDPSRRLRRHGAPARSARAGSAGRARRA